MTDLDVLQQAARIVEDEQGEQVVQIPLKIWEQVITGIRPKMSQKAQIMALLREWENEPEDNMPDEWWDEFSDFLNSNRVNFGERDLDVGDE